MIDAFTKKVINASSDDEFCFYVKCDHCDKRFYSIPVTFSCSEAPVTSEAKKIIYGLLRQKEYQLAYEKAVRQIIQNFSECPMCRQWVCDDCFCICDEIDLCEECVRDLGESGLKVSQKPQD